jgi:hypothetical protein
MATIKKYLSLVKFSHTIFAMPFALIGFFLGIISLRKIPHVKYDMSLYSSASSKCKKNNHF